MPSRLFVLSQLKLLSESNASLLLNCISPSTPAAVPPPPPAASRVVPLTGGFVPAFTFVLAYFFLAERLGSIEIFAFAVLVAGGVLIKIEKNGKGSKKGYIYSLILLQSIFTTSFPSHMRITVFSRPVLRYKAWT